MKPKKRLTSDALFKKASDASKHYEEDWRRLHNGELHDLYCCSLNIIVVIKSTRMEWTGYVDRMDESRDVYKIWLGKAKERDHL